MQYERGKHMVNLSQEICVNIINEIIKIVPYLEVDIKQQVTLRNKIEEQLNDYEITSKCTDLVKGDIIDKALMFLACKKWEGVKVSTRKNYIYVFKRMNTYFNKPITSITTADLRIFLAKEYKDNQLNSVNTKISNIKAFFSWLQDEGYIIQNPTKNLKLAKVPYRKRGHMKQEDVEEMRLQCNTTRDNALLEFILSTGCRVSEVTDALIGNINWKENSINVIGKGDKERTVYFSTRARLYLIKYINDRQEKGIYSDSLFIASKSPHAKLGQRSIEKIIKDISVRAEISYNVFPHLLRHQFCNNGVEQNVPMPIMQHLMGHSNAQTTSLYYEVNEKNVKQEYRKIAL